MSRYVLAVKRSKRAAGISTELVQEFPGLKVVGTSDPHVVSVEAEPASISAFKRVHGADFLVEEAKTRDIPTPSPFAGSLV